MRSPQSRTSRARRTLSGPRHLTVAVLTAILLLALAAPAVAGQWYDESFSSGRTDVYTPTRSWLENAWRGTSNGHTGNGLYTELRKGSHYGASSQLELADLGRHDEEAMYWRYWLRLHADFRLEHSSRGKLPGPAGLTGSGCKGGTPSTPSRPCWSARTMMSRDAYYDRDHPDYVRTGHDQTLLGSYVYHLDQESESRGDLLSWNEAGLVDHGQWVCVEGYVRLNTPGAADGALVNWVDGERAFDRRDFRFRRSGEADLDIHSFWMDAYHGGKETSPATSGIWFDSLALSTGRIGCDDSNAGYDFVDHAGSTHHADIDWLGARGITKGCNPPQNTQYCPGEPVSRGEMAAFLTRALELPAASGDRFSDDDGTFESSIESLAAADITKGCNPPDNTRFCPGSSVTRGEMAAFLARAWNLPRSPSPFTDTDGSNFGGDIGAIARVGITQGCNPPDNDRYCPDKPVTREQMASFLRRAAVRPPG